MTDVRVDGGPAFPSDPKRMQIGDDGIVVPLGHDGMSLRDWFAGQCLRDTFAALAAAGYANFNDSQLKRRAEEAYQAADAMLAERQKP